MSTTGYAYALTLSQQAIALFLRFSARRSLLGMYEVRSHSLFHNRRSPH
ncbi:MAG: hypothetical protein V7L04_25105 [Nostoc sp.]